MGNDENKSGGIGGLIGAVIIITLLIAGGWYFIGGRVEKIQVQKQQVQQEQEAATTIGDVVTGSSTEIEDIQSDLNNVNLDALDIQ